MTRYKKELRWKVRRVYPGDLQSALQKLTDNGWNIVGNHPDRGRFVVVANRSVRVKK